jgi:hypothetical protein
MKRWQRTFIESLAQTGNVSAASRAAGRSRAFVYQARQRYPGFAAAWAQALEEASDRLEMEALRRAVDGVREDKFYRGAIVGQIIRYSDGLLMFLLKARRPDLFDSHAAGCRQGEDGDDNAASDARNVTELRRRMASMCKAEQPAGDQPVPEPAERPGGSDPAV